MNSFISNWFGKSRAAVDFLAIVALICGVLSAPRSFPMLLAAFVVYSLISGTLALLTMLCERSRKHPGPPDNQEHLSGLKPGSGPSIIP